MSSFSGWDEDVEDYDMQCRRAAAATAAAVEENPQFHHDMDMLFSHFAATSNPGSL